MRSRLVAILVLALLVAGISVAQAQPPPEFKLGFKVLADQIPDVVGQPLEDEHWGDNGDSLQRTSNGLMAWRKADNWTAFTNGSRTWVNGPTGVQDRPNDQRFEWERDQQGSAIPAGAVQGRAVRAVDGDTIDVDIPGQGVKRVRYILVNTPESVDPRRPVEYMGEESSKKNKEIVEGQTVFLEKDLSETDRYGRLLRYVYLPDGRMVNEELLRQGYAQVAVYPPDIRYVDRFRAVEKEAREAARGLWGPVEMYGPEPQPLGPSSSTITDPEVQGFYVTSSYPTARLYYHWSDSRWKDLAESNRRWFNSVEELLAAFPGRQSAQ